MTAERPNVSALLENGSPKPPGASGSRLGAETGVYFMPMTGRYAIAIMFMQAVKTGGLGLPMLWLLSKQSLVTEEVYLPIDATVWLPAAGAMLLFAVVSGWLAFKIIRRSRRARRWAFVVTSLFVAFDLLVLASAVTNIGFSADYELGLVGAAGTGIDIAALFLLGSHSVAEWCDR